MQSFPLLTALFLFYFFVCLSFFIDWEFWNARPYVNSVHKKSRVVASNAKNTQSNDEDPQSKVTT